MSSVTSMRFAFDDEKSLASTSFNATYQNIGTALTHNPAIIIFDNQTDVSVPVSVNKTTIWKTFSSGQALVLDLRANHGTAPDGTLDLGTQFSTNASAGTTGSFRISILYARPNSS